MPDGIAAYTVGGRTYILTANEGDSRDWAGGEAGEYSDETKAKLTSMDGTTTTKKVTMLADDYDGLPGLGDGTNYLRRALLQPVRGGADGLTLVYDSARDFERKTAAWLPDYFNCSNDGTDADGRSNKKGPEPENVTVGEMGGKTYAFVGLERVGGVMVYDVTDPASVSFVNYINSRDFDNVNEDGIGRDDSPEGLKFVPAGKSPTGGALLLAAFEVSGDVTAYALTPQTPAEKPVELAIFSDPHLYDAETLGTEGDAFAAYLANDRKMIAESEDILDEALRRILASDASYVLVSGDLTKDGEKLDHELMAEKLALLEQHGKKVFVINGNHDLSNAGALSYSIAGTSSVDTVDQAGFTVIYAGYGYDEAVARDADSLSYAVDLDSKYRLIVIDSCIYNNLTGESRSQETGGRLSNETLNWVLGQIRSAVTSGRRPIGMLHHGLVSHTAVQPVLFPEYLLEDYETVAARLADAGMGLVFTGHFHSQDVASFTTSSGSTLCDMETGSLVTYPCPIRYVTLDGSTVTYRAKPSTACRNIRFLRLRRVTLCPGSSTRCPVCSCR
jgi:3',5'-cyclic AMP phosphodiesterase CpdA